MKVIKRDLGGNIDKLTIIPISDVHIGDKTANIKAFKEVIERIKNEPNTYAILNGDICNFAFKNSKSDCYIETLSPMTELLEAIKYLEEIREKLLVLCSGNHEDRLSKETNIDAMYLIAKQLGLEELYAPSWWYLYLTFGNNKAKGDNRPILYTITGYHGSGSSQTTGAKANKVKKMSQVVLADIYLMSHVHEPIQTKGIIYTPDYQHRSIVKKEMYYCISNAFVEYNGSYAEKMGLIPSNNGITEMQLDGHKKLVKLIM